MLNTPGYTKSLAPNLILNASEIISDFECVSNRIRNIALKRDERAYTQSIITEKNHKATYFPSF
jgi:hypothetical protein